MSSSNNQLNNGPALPAATMPDSSSPPSSSTSIEAPPARRSGRSFSPTTSSFNLDKTVRQEPSRQSGHPSFDPVLEQIGGYESDGDDRFIMPSTAPLPKPGAAARAAMKRKREASDDSAISKASNPYYGTIDLPVAKKVKTDTPPSSSPPRVARPRVKQSTKQTRTRHGSIKSMPTTRLHQKDLRSSVTIGTKSRSTSL